MIPPNDYLNFAASLYLMVEMALQLPIVPPPQSTEEKTEHQPCPHLSFSVAVPAFKNSTRITESEIYEREHLQKAAINWFLFPVSSTFQELVDVLIVNTSKMLA